MSSDRLPLVANGDQVVYTEEIITITEHKQERNKDPPLVFNEKLRVKGFVWCIGQ